MLNVNMAHLIRNKMLGLPDITVYAVSGVVVIIILALLYWGLTFRGHD